MVKRFLTFFSMHLMCLDIHIHFYPFYVIIDFFYLVYSVIERFLHRVRHLAAGNLKSYLLSL